jgi:predicted aspartyl protease
MPRVRGCLNAIKRAAWRCAAPHVAGLLGALGTAALLVTSLGAQVYHWVDDQGIIHYTTGIESVPERHRADARVMAGSPVDAPLPPSPPARTGATTIPFTAGRPIVVAAQINGAGPVTLILDTGADRTMVAPGTLARLGIAAAAAGRAEIRGVTGTVLADVLWVDFIEVSNARAGPLAIVAHDAGLAEADGLLGRDFLSLFSVAIDARASIVTLEPN